MALAGLHKLRIAPVSNVNVEAWQKALNSAPQQCRKVTRHGSHDQKLRSFVMTFAIEMLQLSKGLTEQDLFVNRDVGPMHVKMLDPEFGFRAGRRSVGEHFEACGNEGPN